MPRSPRASSKSGVYHVTMRGNAKVVIFETDGNRRYFLKLLARYRTECNIEIIAWCLMDNHVHLVLDANDADLSAVLQKVATAYAVYYNRTENRVGHLFQCPFRSKPIEYEEQLINTIRYVHQNPERAGICLAREYAWSSYAEYNSEPWLVNTKMVLDIVGSLDDLLNKEADLDYVVRDNQRRVSLTDNEAEQLLIKELGIRSCAAVGGLPKHERNRIILDAASLRLQPSQIARLFGVGERTVYRVVSYAKKRPEAHMVPIKWQKGSRPN